VFSVYGLPQLTVHTWKWFSNSFSSKKYKSGDQKIILCEDNKVINNSNEVSNLFNNFFATVAEKIGENVVYDPSNHPSITAIIYDFFPLFLM
jgi:hypothetical protein